MFWLRIHRNGKFKNFLIQDNPISQFLGVAISCHAVQDLKMLKLKLIQRSLSSQCIDIYLEPSDVKALKERKIFIAFSFSANAKLNYFKTKSIFVKSAL